METRRTRIWADWHGFFDPLRGVFIGQDLQDQQDFYRQGRLSPSLKTLYILFILSEKIHDARKEIKNPQSNRTSNIGPIGYRKSPPCRIICSDALCPHKKSARTGRAPLQYIISTKCRSEEGQRRPGYPRRPLQGWVQNQASVRGVQVPERGLAGAGGKNDRVVFPDAGLNMTSRETADECRASRPAPRIGRARVAPECRLYTCLNRYAANMQAAWAQSCSLLSTHGGAKSGKGKFCPAQGRFPP